MKILVVSNVFPPVVRGGYEVECSGVVDMLRRRGDDVRVLTSTAGSAAAEHGTFRELPLLPETKWAQVISPLHAAAAARTVRVHLADVRPDLVFVWNGAQIPHSAFHAILSSGVPTAFRVCEQWFSGLFTRDLFMRYLSRRHTGLRRGWSAVARGVNRLPAFGLMPEIRQRVAISWVSESLRQAVQVPAGLDPVLERTIHATTQVGAELSELERRPAATPLVAYVGRLSPEKGPDVAVDAVARLAERGVEVELVIAGDGPRQEAHRLKRAIQKTGVPRLYTVPGWLDFHELGELLARAWVLVVPSVWEEPLGLVVVEGALARVPLVASHVGGIPELVGDDEALLVPPGDAVALAEAIENVIQKPVEAAERAARAFARLSSASWESYSEATASFVDDAYTALTGQGVVAREAS